MKEDKIILGSWGIGGSLSYKLKENKTLIDGIFKGFEVPLIQNERLSNIRSLSSLPPISKFKDSEIDLSTFLFYDKVIIDIQSFENLLNGIYKQLDDFSPNKIQIKILERLASENKIELIDYLSLIESVKDKEMLDNMILNDLNDPRIISPITLSLDSWIEFNKVLLQKSDSELLKFYTMKESMRNKYPDHFSLGYAYECLSDINRMILISDKLKTPLLDWESYKSYYIFKNNRSRLNSEEGLEHQKFNKMMDLFIPEFKIQSFEHLLELKEDKRLNNVKKLLNTKSKEEINQEMVNQAYEDAIKSNHKSKMYKRFTILIPLVGTINEFVPPQISMPLKWTTDQIIDKLVKLDDVQAYFVDAARNYEKHRVIEKNELNKNNW